MVFPGGRLPMPADFGECAPGLECKPYPGNTDVMIKPNTCVRMSKGKFVTDILYFTSAQFHDV